MPLAELPCTYARDKMRPGLMAEAEYRALAELRISHQDVSGGRGDLDAISLASAPRTPPPGWRRT